MLAIDLVILGMLKKKPMGAYELQKLVEYRSISKWVKISTPSIYKKVLQLEENGFVTSRFERDGNMPEKAVYSLTDKGKKEFERLMLDLSRRPVRLFLDCNSVAVNLDSMPKKKRQECVQNICKSVRAESGIGGAPRAKTRRARCPGGGHGSPAPTDSFGGRARTVGGDIANAGINFRRRILIILFTEEK